MLYGYIIIILLAGFIILLVSHHLTKRRELTQKLKLSEQNYRDLEEKYEAIYRNLEKKIHTEVEKNRQKDHLLIQHSRLAAMGEMMASIGHQWRQPLNSLSLLIQDVREEYEFGELTKSYIDRFTKESMTQIKHMSHTINDFQKFYQPNKEKSPFSIVESIEGALSVFAPSIKYYGIQVEFEYRGQQNAFGHANEYSQVVLNILINARDAFIQNDLHDRKITIVIDETDEYITTEFHDNAGGIDTAVLSKIFDPYFTTRKNGTGLGLYMTKMILEKMNGYIRVKNETNGACFSLSVPKVPATIKRESVLI